MTSTESSSKVTPSMQECLSKFQCSLTCSLCNRVMVDPVTLQCAHSFCLSCIQTNKSWTCPGKKHSILFI